VSQYGIHAGYNQDKEAKRDAAKNLTPEQKKDFNA